MDMSLNGRMDGVQTAQILRDQWNVPVVYLTGHDEESIVSRAKPTRPLGYILKPYSAEEIFRTIDLALYNHQVEKNLSQREFQYRYLSDATQVLISSMDPQQVAQRHAIPKVYSDWRELVADRSLQVIDIAAPTSAAEGSTIEVTWTVRNEGEARATGSWCDSVVLRNVANPAVSPITLGAFDYTAGLGAGQEAFGCALAGGDTDRTPGPLSVSITAFASCWRHKNHLARRCLFDPEFGILRGELIERLLIQRAERTHPHN